MRNNDFLEKENFKALLETDKVDRVEDRLNIIDIFLSTEEHITLEGLYHLLRERGLDYDKEFIRHCMNRMVELGFAQRKSFQDQPVRYEHRHLGKHHDHLVCTKCGEILEFANEDMERLQARVAAAHGFHMLQHRMEIYGLCSKCLAQREPVVPLSMARSGETVIIKEIVGGREARARLGDMGLRTGDQVEIINNNGLGRLILGRGSTRLAMGRGIAHKIMVTLVDRAKGLLSRDFT